MIISLAEARLHLRLDQTDEDSLVTIFIKAAQEHIESYLNQPIPGLYDSPPYAPDAIKAAALLIVGDLYENRQGSMQSNLKTNPAVISLLQPYRVNMGI